jgi:hypothetical protein
VQPLGFTYANMLLMQSLPLIEHVWITLSFQVSIYGKFDTMFLNYWSSCPTTTNHAFKNWAKHNFFNPGIRVGTKWYAGWFSLANELTRRAYWWVYWLWYQPIFTVRTSLRPKLVLTLFVIPTNHWLWLLVDEQKVTKYHRQVGRKCKWLQHMWGGK